MMPAGMPMARERGSNITMTLRCQLSAGNAQVVAVDPGDDGAMVRRDRDDVCRFRPISHWDAVVELIDWERPLVVLLEDQFMARNADSMKELAFTSGALMGHLRTLAPGTMTVVHVVTETWQAAQRRRMGVSGKPSRAEGIELAIQEMLKDGQTKGFNLRTKALQEGAASAYGILRWWEGIGADG